MASQIGGSDGPLSDDKISAIVGKQISEARLYYNSDRSGYRNKALEYFEGEETVGGDVPPQEGRSKIVSRDVADVHGMIMPSLMRVFFSSDRVAIYEPTRKETEDFASQATDYVNYVVMKECDGYRHFRDAISDGTLIGNGILKHYWDKQPIYRTESFTGLSEDSYRLLLQDPDIEEVVKEDSYPDPSAPPPMPMAPQPGMGPQGMAPQGMPPMGMSPQASVLGLNAPPSPAPESTEDVPGQQGAMPDVSPGMGPAPAGPELLYDCTIKRKVASGRLRIVAIPYEEFLIEPSARLLDEENCRFVAHARYRTRSSLIEEGFDPDKVDSLPAFTGDTETQQGRQLRDPKVLFTQEGPDRSTDLIEIHECYVQLDADGDGIAEWMRVVMGGIQGQRNILIKEEWGDDLPFTDITPDPRPYTWRGFGLYDLIGDIQKIKTVLMRSVLDNTYWVSNPQRAGDLTQVRNPDEVFNPTFNGFIDTANPQNIVPLPQPFVVDKLAPVIDKMDEVSQRRTGISPQSQALDLDVLQHQSATAVNAATSAAFSKVEEYARNIAECGGLKRAFKCILKLVVKHQDRPKTIRLRGKWVDMDPRAWDADMDVSVNTGLGAGSREKDLQMLSNILSIQQQALQVGGPNNPLAGLDKISNTCIKLVETAGVKSPEQFFNEIGPEQMQQIASQPPPPDPKMVAIQAKAQSDQQHAQIEQMKAQVSFAIQQSEAQANQARVMAEIEKAKADAQAKISEAQAKIIESNARARESQLEQQLAAAKLQLDLVKSRGDNQTELTKAAIDNLVRLEIARINASKDTDTRPDVVEQRIGRDAGVSFGQQ